MAGRAYWKGYLKLSLVSCPVKLYSATSSTRGRVSFNLLHKDTLNRVKQKYHDPELGEVERSDLVKGYQFEKDNYVVVTAEELSEIEIESSKTIEIDGFVDADEIDPIYLDNSYYLGADGPIADETYAVLQKAIAESGKVAVARLVLSGRERMVAIRPIEEGFMLNTIRTGKEVREPSYGLEEIEADVGDDMLMMARQIIESKSMEFDPKGFEDRYENALLALVKSKIDGGEPVIAKAPERGNVVNLMDALKASVEGEVRAPAPSLSKEKKPAAKKKATKKKTGTS